MSDISGNGEAMAAFQAIQTLVFWSPLVIGMRLPVLASETMMFRHEDRIETNLLVPEKMGAIVEGAYALQMACVSVALRLVCDAATMQLERGSLVRAAGTMIAAGFEPAAARVRDNAERLGVRAGAA